MQMDFLLPESPLAAIDRDQHQQCGAQHHTAYGIRHLHGGQQAGDECKHDRPGHAAPITAFTAGEQCSPHGDCRNGREQEGLSELQKHHACITDHQESTETRQHPCQGIGCQVDGSHIHAG